MRPTTGKLVEGKLHVIIVSQHHDDTQSSLARYMVHTCETSVLLRWTTTVFKTSSGRFGTRSRVSSSLEDVLHNRDDFATTRCTDAALFGFSPTVSRQITYNSSSLFTSMRRRCYRHQVFEIRADERALPLHPTRRLTAAGACRTSRRRVFVWSKHKV